MWILLIVLWSGTIENLEFSNIESCHHAIDVLKIENAKHIGCYHTNDKSVLITPKPGIDSF